MSVVCVCVSVSVCVSVCVQPSRCSSSNTSTEVCLWTETHRRRYLKTLRRSQPQKYKLYVEVFGTHFTHMQRFTAFLCY